MTTTRGAGLEAPDVAVGSGVAHPSAGTPESARADEATAHGTDPGPFARLGRWAATHFRRVLVVWLLVLARLRILRHPRGERSGRRRMAGLEQPVGRGTGHRSRRTSPAWVPPPCRSWSSTTTARSPPTRRPRPSWPRRPTSSAATPGCPPSSRHRPGVSLSRDGRTAVITAGVGRRLQQDGPGGRCGREPARHALHRPAVSVTLTGDSALWANFNTANRSAMMRSEMLSWPVTIIILVIAFGSLVAAGLPLMLTMAGLLVAAGALVLATQFTPVSIWALNFALMFALALGIDYALFLVVRFRAALERRGARTGATGRPSSPRSPRRSTPPARPSPSAPSPSGFAGGHPDRAEPGLPVNGPRHHAVGHCRARRHPDPACPPCSASSGPTSTRAAIRLPARSSGRRRGGTARPGPALAGASSCGAIRSRPAQPPLSCFFWPPRRSSGCGPTCPRSPSAGHANARVGYDQVTDAFGPGAPGTLQVLVPKGEQAQASPRWPTAPGWPASCPGRPAPAGPSTRWSPPPAPRRRRPARPSTGSATCCRPGRWSAGPRPRTTTFSSRWLRTPRSSWPSWASSDSCCCSSPSVPR